MKIRSIITCIAIIAFASQASVAQNAYHKVKSLMVVKEDLSNLKFDSHKFQKMNRELDSLVHLRDSLIIVAKANPFANVNYEGIRISKEIANIREKLPTASDQFLIAWKAFLDDPFVNHRLSGVSPPKVDDNGNLIGYHKTPGGQLKPGVPLLGSAISLPTQSMILDALAQYLAEEFKKGMTASYMMGFEKTLGQVGELQVLFPSTYAKLKSADISKLPDLGKGIKVTFANDLRDMLHNLLDHIENYEYSDVQLPMKILDEVTTRKIKKSTVYPIAKLGMEIGDGLIQGVHPSEILSTLNEQYPWGKEGNTNSLGVLIHGVYLIESNLRDTSTIENPDKKKYWISASQVAAMSPEEMKYFFGIIYQADTEYFEYLSKKYLVDPNSSLHPMQALLVRVLNGVLPKLGRIQELVRNRSYETDENDYVQLMMLVAEILIDADSKVGSGLFWNIEVDDKGFPIKENLGTSQFLRMIIDQYDQIRRKEYSNIPSTVVMLLEKMVVHVPDGSKAQEVISRFIKYGEFMVAIASADSAAQIKEIIKQHVAPPSTFAIKRTYPFSMSISAHPGFYFSGERFENAKEIKANLGLTAPIGLELNFGIVGNKSKTTVIAERDSKGSLGVFLQAFDLGAIMNYRLNDDSSSTLPDTVGFLQVISPGISLNYGLPRSGLTFGIGYQRTPQLRELKVATAVENYPFADRIFVRISWDLPLLNLGRVRSCKNLH